MTPTPPPAPPPAPTPTPGPAPAPTRDPGPVPGELPVYAAGGALCVTTLLTWKRIDFGGFGGQLGRDMGDMFQQLGQATGQSTSFSGLEFWQGVMSLLAALGCVGLTWAEVSGTLRGDRARIVLGAAAAAALAALGVLLALVSGRGLTGAFGLYLAVPAAGALVWFALQRVKASNERRAAPPA